MNAPIVRIMQTLGERIKKARLGKGYPSAVAACEAFGWSISTYTQHENGIRTPKDPTLERYASRFGVSFEWLKLGDKKGNGLEQTVRFAGIIGAGGEVYPNDDDFAHAVSGAVGIEDGEAFEVRGDSMMPLARNGDIAFFGPPAPIKRLIGRECLIELEDGRRLFKTLERGAKEGLYSLMSYNAAPIRDVEVVAAGEFLGIRRQWRR